MCLVNLAFLHFQAFNLPCGRLCLTACGAQCDDSLAAHIFGWDVHALLHEGETTVQSVHVIVQHLPCGGCDVARVILAYHDGVVSIDVSSLVVDGVVDGDVSLGYVREVYFRTYEECHARLVLFLSVAVEVLVTGNHRA